MVGEHEPKLVIENDLEHVARLAGKTNVKELTEQEIVNVCTLMGPEVSTVAYEGEQ